MLLFNENIHFSWVKQEIFIISRQLSFYFCKTQFWLLEISDNSVQFLKNSVLKRQKLSFSEISMAWMSALVSKKQACTKFHFHQPLARKLKIRGPRSAHQASAWKHLLSETVGFFMQPVCSKAYIVRECSHTLACVLGSLVAHTVCEHTKARKKTCPECVGVNGDVGKATHTQKKTEYIHLLKTGASDMCF